MAAEVKRATGLDAELRVGSSGELSVWLDDKLVAQKQRGMFPTPAGVVTELKKLLGT